jgi:hypothetical protein
MKLIDILTSSVVAILFGLLLILGAGSSFGGSVGVILVCYGLFGVGYVGVKQLFP